jgi:hypothetical protein
MSSSPTRMHRLLEVSVEIERRHLLALIASRFAGAPEPVPATRSRAVVLCDESIPLLSRLLQRVITTRPKKSCRLPWRH